MSERAHPPFRALSGPDSPTMSVRMLDVAGVNAQALTLGPITEDYRELPLTDRRRIAQAFSAESVSAILVDADSVSMLPGDAMNLAHVELTTFTHSLQGESFANKIVRILGSLREELDVPSQALAVSVTTQSVVILPFVPNDSGERTK